ASPSPDAGGRCAGRPSGWSRHRAPARGAARREPPGAAARSSSCSCESRCSHSWWRSSRQVRVLERVVVPVILTDDLRYEHARLDGHGLVDDALLLRVVAHLDVAGEREVLAERVADEAVVREDAAQVRMAAEQDAEEVERLALEPVCATPH